MRNFREAVLLAEGILLHLGADGRRFVSARAMAVGQAGDDDEVRFWSAVAYALTTMASTPTTLTLGPAASPAPFASPGWWLMQRVEGYRHLAWLSETPNDSSPGGLDPERLDAAAGWRQVAADLHQLAETMTG